LNGLSRSPDQAFQSSGGGVSSHWWSAVWRRGNRRLGFLAVETGVDFFGEVMPGRGGVLVVGVDGDVEPVVASGEPAVLGAEHFVT
jgi:hypothetical protein